MSEDFKRPKMYGVPASQLRLDPENERKDLGDMDWLIENIDVEGVKDPVHGYSKIEDGVKCFFVVDGQHRFTAVQHLLKTKGKDIIVNCIPSMPEKDKELNIIGRWLRNTGKDLTPLEKSNSIGKLINYNWSKDKIAKSLSISTQYVSDLQMLYSAPQRLKDLIESGRMEGTFAIELLKKKDFDIYVFLDDVAKGKYDPQPKPQQPTLENLVIPAEENAVESENEPETAAPEAPKGKITRKTISSGVNSFKSFKKWAKAATTYADRIPASKRPIYDFMMDVINDRVSELDFIKYFNEE